MKSKCVSLNNCFGVFLFALFLFPTFPLYTRGNAYYGTLITIAIIVGFSWCIISVERFRKIPKSIFLSAVIYSVAFFILTIIALISSYEKIVTRDFVELIKPPVALILFFASYLVFKDIASMKELLLNNLERIFIIVALIGIFEAYFGIDLITQYLYFRPRDVLEGKALSPFGITYFYGAFMLYAGIYFWVNFASGRRISILYFALCMFALISSQSRTIFISVIFLFFIFLFIYPLYKEFIYKKRIFSFSVLLILISMIVVVLSWSHVKERYYYLYNGLSRVSENGINPNNNTYSENKRLNQVLWSLENNNNVIVGEGIGKGYAPPMESFYALYWYRYGLLGIMLYIALAIFYLRMTYLAAQFAIRNNHLRLYALFVASHIFVLLLPITSLSSVITDQFVMMFLYYGMIGVTLKYILLNKGQLKDDSVSLDNGSPPLR